MDLLNLFSFRKNESFQAPNSSGNPKAFRSLLDRLGELKPMTAKETMIPRALVQGIDTDVEISRLHFGGNAFYYPVYEGDLDHILGWIGQDRLRGLMHNGHVGNLRHEFVPAEVIPETMPLDQAFLKFVQSSVPLFVVHDANGVTSGVLYLSDVLEVFFGLEMEPAHGFAPPLLSPQMAHG